MPNSSVYIRTRTLPVVIAVAYLLLVPILSVILSIFQTLV